MAKLLTFNNNNPLAVSWGHAVRALRGQEQISKVAALLQVSNSFLRLVETAGAKISSNKALNVITAFPQLEFQPLVQFLGTLNMVSAASDDYSQYEQTVRKIQSLIGEDDYGLHRLLQKLIAILKPIQTLDKDVVEPLLLKQKFEEDIITYLSTSIIRQRDIHKNDLERIGINDDALNSGLFDNYDISFRRSIEEGTGVYVEAAKELLNSLNPISPNLFIKETNKWEEQKADSFVSVIGLFRDFSWMPTQENTEKFPLRYLLNSQFKELKYIILNTEGTAKSWEDKFKKSLFKQWVLTNVTEVSKGLSEDYINECLDKITIKKATLDTPLVKEYLQTVEDRTNDLVWVFVTKLDTKIGFSMLSQDKNQHIAFGQALSYIMAKQKYVLFNAIWDSLK